MKSKPFHSKFFSDAYILELSVVEKMVFIYYVFNERVNWLGTYEISDRTVLFELGDVTKDQLKQAKSRLQTDNKILFFEHWVILRNSERYDTHLNNPQLMSSAIKQYLALPEKIRSQFLSYKPKEVLKQYLSSVKQLPTSSLPVGEGEGEYQEQGERERKITDGDINELMKGVE